MKDLNIVYVNYQTASDIIDAVASVFRDIEGSKYDIQVTVVDNSGNRDGIAQELKQFPTVKYIDALENIGFGAGNTVGFEATPARYYFALNRDTIIPDDKRTIDRLISFMDEHPKIGCIGPKLLNSDGTVQDSCYRFDLVSMLIKPLKQLQWHEDYKFVKRLTDRMLMKDFDRNKTQPVDWVLGAAMLVRAEVSSLIGWFDPRYFMYLEDADWCRSMWAHGWPVYYVHDIEIIHRYARDSAKVPGLKALIKNPLARMHVRSWLRFLWKWRGKFRHLSL
ncbi:MAG: glycosyltransferase family 2 protein [Candidatus Magasanikbacteria bacterium]|nr:glycosyltransferase family 2 protein [Candidatus Magasanikbacteria bacterium]